jgi:hypothetical protein
VELKKCFPSVLLGTAEKLGNGSERTAELEPFVPNRDLVM